VALKLITAAAENPVSLEEAKSHLREVDTDNDTLIGTMVSAATKYAERFLGRALVDQTWELHLDEFPTAEDELAIKIPLPPLIEVESIKYDDASGVEQTLSDDQYVVDNVSQPGWVVPVSTWPTPNDAVNSVRIRFRAGYLDQSVSPAQENVPENLKAAILLHVGAMFAHREEVVVGQAANLLPFGARAMLELDRIDLSMA
jgi:uncharacterized phiE125 gp8 family phage protein